MPMTPKMGKPTLRYEVRVPGDGDSDYFVEPAQPEFDPQRYDPNNLDSAKGYAKFCGGWVVAVREETVYDPKPNDGVSPRDPEGDDV